MPIVMQIQPCVQDPDRFATTFSPQCSRSASSWSERRSVDVTARLPPLLATAELRLWRSARKAYCRRVPQRGERSPTATSRPLRREALASLERVNAECQAGRHPHSRPLRERSGARGSHGGDRLGGRGHDHPGPSPRRRRGAAHCGPENAPRRADGSPLAHLSDPGTPRIQARRRRAAGADLARPGREAPRDIAPDCERTGL
jgi:hypothetical protein